MHPAPLPSAFLALAVTLTGCGEDEENGETAESADVSTSSGTDGADAGDTTTDTSSTSAGETGTTGDGDGDGGVFVGDGDGDGTASAWFGDEPTVHNIPDPCLTLATVTPAAGEAGHLYAVRLTPPSYPFEVTEVVYEMLHDGAMCDAQPAHRVEVFVESATAPAASPANPVVLNVPADAPMGLYRHVEMALPSPITLVTGEHLFVAVELPNVDSSCIATCDGATVFDRDYWSGATAAPYSWATLNSYMIDANALVGINGQ
jgi:hypothetical protein